MNKYLYLEKTDSIGARLREITVGLVLSKIVNRKLLVFWSTDVEWIKYRSSEELLSPKNIFHKEFLDNHFTEKSLKKKAKTYRIWPICKISYIYLKFSPHRIIMLKKVPKYDPFIRFINQDRWHKELKKAFNKIKFSNDAQLAIKAGKKSIKPKSIAIHARQGDVVSGEYRYSGNWTKKAIPVPVITEIIKKIKSSGRNSVVVSKDQQLPKWLKLERKNYLSNKQKINYTFSKEIQSVFYDIGTMSECDEIIMGNDCNFGLVSAWSENKKISFALDYFNKKDLKLILSKLTSGEKLAPKNIDIAYFCQWVITQCGHMITEKEIDNLISIAIKHDHLNPVYHIYMSALEVINGNIQKGEKFAQETINIINKMDSYTKKRFLKDFGIGLPERILPYKYAKILVQISLNYPEKNKSIDKISLMIRKSRSWKNYNENKFVQVFKKIINICRNILHL